MCLAIYGVDWRTEEIYPCVIPLLHRKDTMRVIPNARWHKLRFKLTAMRQTPSSFPPNKVESETSFYLLFNLDLVLNFNRWKYIIDTKNKTGRKRICKKNKSFPSNSTRLCDTRNGHFIISKRLHLEIIMEYVCRFFLRTPDTNCVQIEYQP